MRKRGDQLLNKNDFKRIVDAARSKNLPIAAVEATQAPDGTKTVKVIVGEPAKAGSTAEGNELDKWMSDHARETQRA
jgi:hypothetical protein